MGKRKSPKDKEGSDSTGAGIAKLKKALEFEQLKIVALNTMIDIAEENFNITIREKRENNKASINAQLSPDDPAIGNTLYKP